jgi:hypothetical protein
MDKSLFNTIPYTDALNGFRPLEISRALGSRAYQLVTDLEREGFAVVHGTDFREFLALQQANENEGFLPLFSPLHPDLSPHPEKFWLGVVAPTGDIVATTCAVYCYIPANETLADQLHSLRLLYADPARAAGQGARVRSTAPLARTIQGRVQMMLGFWTDPDWRKRGLARRACHLAMLLGVSEWQPDYTIGFVDDTSSLRLTWRDRARDEEGYGWRHREPEIAIDCPYIGPIVEDLVAMTRAQLEDQIIRYRPIVAVPSAMLSAAAE